MTRSMGEITADWSEAFNELMAVAVEMRDLKGTTIGELVTASRTLDRLVAVTQRHAALAVETRDNFRATQTDGQR